MADFLIGKPGTMTLTESLITGTPFIFIKSTGLDALQGANERWVVEQGIGVMAQNPETVDVAVRQVLNDGDMKDRIRANHHDGVSTALDFIQSRVESTRFTETVRKSG